MNAAKRYLLRDTTGHYFKSVSGDGCEAHFTDDPECAYRFTKDEIKFFRRDYDYIKGRTVLLSTALKGSASHGE